MQAHTRSEFKELALDYPERYQDARAGSPSRAVSRRRPPMGSVPRWSYSALAPSQRLLLALTHPSEK